MDSRSAAHALAQIADFLELKGENRYKSAAYRNAAGAMVPLGSLLTIGQTFGPETVQRYNGYRSADISGGAEHEPHFRASATVEPNCT